MGLSTWDTLNNPITIIFFIVIFAQFVPKCNNNKRKLFLLLQKTRLFASARPSNVMEDQLPCRLPVSHSRKFIHPLLHMPTTHIFLLDGIRADVHRERKELQ